jgi:hypothetical protein
VNKNHKRQPSAGSKAQEAYAAGRSVGQTLKQLEEAKEAIDRAVRNARASNGVPNR